MMEIDTVTNYDALLSQAGSINSVSKQQLVSNVNAGFEKIFNSVMTKELLKPLLNSSLFSGQEQYSYIIENTLIEYFNDKQPLINVADGEVHNDK